MVAEFLSIVAVGGGTPMRSRAFLEHAVELTGVEHGANVLIVPTPATTEDKYSRRVDKALKLYRETLGLPTDVLHDFGVMPPLSEVEDKISTADVVYIVGGDTTHTMREWAEHGIDKLLKTRALGGMVLSGTSTGAIAPFAWGHCDIFPDRQANAGEYTAVGALGLIPAGITTHSDRLQSDGGVRGDDFLRMVPSENAARGLRYGFGIDGKAALVITEGQISWQGFNGGQITLVETIDGEASHTKMIAGETIRLDFLDRNDRVD